MLRMAFVALTASALLAVTGPALGSTAGKGSLFYNGGIVGTVVPPAAFPNTGTDPFFKVTNGVSGQLGIAGVAPGAAGYHGGHWAVSVVTFEGAPYLLTSQAAVETAEATGDVTVTRAPDADFLCPVQP